jgi:hypothetical protein
MSLAITVVTTANRHRRFFQTDPERCAEMLDTLRRAGNLFSGAPLVIATDSGTEIYSPRTITRVEFETADDLTTYHPASWELRFCALSPEEFAIFGAADGQRIATPVEFFFEGGDTFSAWFEAARDATQAERAMRIAHLFNEPVIPYRLATAGIGLVNPAAMTRLSMGAAIAGLPKGTWYAHEA